MQPTALPQIQQLNTKKRYGIFSKLTVNTPEERRCFLMSPCQWGRSGGYSCTSICFNIFLSIIYFTWRTARYAMRRTSVPPNVTRSTKLRGAQGSPELAFRSKVFRVPENIIFLALWLFICLAFKKSIVFCRVSDSTWKIEVLSEEK